MDLYGLIWFIDETILPDDREFLARYLRRPERYPELSELVQPYCFCTLRSQAASYAKVPRRVLLTYEYTPTTGEQQLYDLLYSYVNQRSRLAFPEMDPYDLALRLLGLLGSSTAAVLQTIRGIIKKLEGLPNAQAELDQWREMETAALKVEQDAKAAALPRVLELGFTALKKRSAAKRPSFSPRAWRPRVDREKGRGFPMAAEAPVFAEVPAEQTAHTGEMRPMIMVRTGGIAVDIYSAADKEMLQTIVQALRIC